MDRYTAYIDGAFFIVVDNDEKIEKAFKFADEAAEIAAYLTELGLAEIALLA